MPSCQGSVADPHSHFTNTTFPTAHKKMAANPRASILYRKNYKMPRPICHHSFVFALALRSGKNFGLVRETQGIYVIICLSLRSNRQSLSRQQGIILIKTANAVLLSFLARRWVLTKITSPFLTNCRVLTGQK